METQSFDDYHRLLSSIFCSCRIGADIIMALDDVVSSVAVDDERFEEATHRTIRWIDRCIAAHERPQEQNLFAIVQGMYHLSRSMLRLQAANTIV